MPLAILHTRANYGIDAPEVTIEVHSAKGLPSLSIVGLPETAVKESKDRVRSAIINSEFEFHPRRLTINLAPADLPKKDGGRFDLPIALGILIATGQLQVENLTQYEFAGELALDGTLRRIPGVLPMAIAAKQAKRILVIPNANASEAGLVKESTILPVNNLLQICHHLTNQQQIEPLPPQHISEDYETDHDLADVHGQHQAKRALEITAAGEHNLLMIGPPGTGKTMLASRLPGILPLMSDDEALQTASIYSIANKKFDFQLWRRRPFRSPHHTASSVALVGGNNPPRPGEISLTHNGVLFLDELPEFSRHVLEVLREPLESGEVTISRAAHQAKFPAKFQLIAAMNPCPCGYLGDSSGRCHCTPKQIQQYRAKISGPLIDRIDLYITVPRLPKELLLTQNETVETSASVRRRVIAARNIQIHRTGKANAKLTPKEITHYCKIKAKDQQIIQEAMEKLNLTARAYHRIVKIARTIADFEESPGIEENHLLEAISYRQIAPCKNA